ncbi:MAG: T9SS type A sorting domain-containing protein [Ferruginibacter sp.]
MKKLPVTATVLMVLLSLTSYAVPKLSSYPSATGTIFLDFDGQTVNNFMWNNGVAFYCAPSGMSDASITEAFNRTAEDYRPFNVNITTDSTVYLAAPIDHRVRIIVTPTSGWFQGVGGVSYVGSFTWGDDTPGFVFCDRLGYSPKLVGECCSHESGHTVGLSHQSRYGSDCITPTETYNSGTGSGEPSWAPIMGNSYYKNMSNWNNGPTPYGCTNIQDNLSIITSQNGFGYRPDDYTETLNASTTALPAGNFTMPGLISTNTDKDAFKFTLNQNSNFHLTAIPYSVGAGNDGANLDIKLEIYNAAGTLINTYDPAETMSIAVDTVLNSGTYYIKISGDGNVNVSQYGSLGSYTLSGTSALLPIHDVALTGNTDNGKHNLSWNIIADEPIKTIAIETSADGINFKSLTTVNSVTTKFSYIPVQNNLTYYRLKVTSIVDQTTYSNTIVLKPVSGNVDNILKVSTLIQSDITINASVPFQYLLSDISGKVISKGNGIKGINNINISNQPNGMYVIQLFSNNQKQTERIIKTVR